MGQAMGQPVHQPVRLTPYLSAQIDRSAAIARQFLPDRREDDIAPAEMADPIGDIAHSPVPGIIHRYPDRVLLMPTPQCSAHCRFCFRRGLPDRPPLSDAEVAAALDYIAGHPEIFEVILSGGDPLTAPPRRLSMLLAALNRIDSIGVIRIHTRRPVIDPDRLPDAAFEAIAASQRPINIVCHINHPDELTEAVTGSLHRLRAAGADLYGQTVLLKGVNDDAAVLEMLFRAMLRHRVRPYYLHYPDLVPGTGHFRTDLTAARTIYADLKRRIGGLTLPRFMLDIPGGFGKVPADGESVHVTRDGYVTLTDPAGRAHSYPGALETPWTKG